MALDLSKRRERRQADVEIDGERVRVGYNQAEVTNRNLRLIDTPATTEQEETDRMAVYARIFLDWDLTDGGQVVPINPESLAAKVDVFLLRRILEGVILDCRPPDPSSMN